MLLYVLKDNLCFSPLQQSRFQDMSENIIGRIDEMGSRIDDLEKSVGELIQNVGVDGDNIESKKE